MTIILGGPLFFPPRDEYRESEFDREGGHYNIFHTHGPDEALAMLRSWYPDGEGDDMNLIFFSTSGIHGSYTTIEEVEKDIVRYGDTPITDDDDDRVTHEVTFLLVQPRLVSMTYGEVACKTLSDVAFLKKLRASSWEASRNIGAK